MADHRRLLVIAGPTASGKTATAVEVCKRVDGEIISADSMQVYKHLSIGTAKPTTKELQGVQCHLIDHVDPDDQYHLGRFVIEARAALDDIRGRGKTAVLCGGTGMYIRGLLHGIFEGGEPAPDIRRELEAAADSEGLAPLFAELERVDPTSAHRYGNNDRQRIIRALEVFRSTGRPLSGFHVQNIEKPEVPARIYVLSWPREQLYKRINRRVDAMLAMGLLDEVQNYLTSGFRRDNPAIKALGYLEMINVIEGNATLENALEVMKRKSRNYAKRQETWFRSVKNAVWIDAADLDETELAGNIVTDWEKFCS